MTIPDDLSIAMVPAYGGMFRPPPPRRWPKVIGVATVIVLLALVVFFVHRRLTRAPIGGECGRCHGGMCIREAVQPAVPYCSYECDSDVECPSGYVCEPTYSGRRKACMLEGAALDPTPTPTYRRRR